MGKILHHVLGSQREAAGVAYDDAANALVLGGTGAGLAIGTSTDAPSPVADNAPRLYAADVAGIDDFMIMSVGHLAAPVARNRAFLAQSAWVGGQATGAGMTFGGAVATTSGTLGLPSPAATNARTLARHTSVASTATAGNVAFVRAAAPGYLRGSAAPLGGFRAVFRVGLITLQAGNRGFFGMSGSAVAPTNVDPLTSTTAAKIGIGFRANTGNLQLICGDSGVVPTVTDLGAGFALDTSSLFELAIGCAAGAAGVSWAVRKVGGAYTSGVITANLPASTALLERYLWMTNNATAAAVAFAVQSAIVHSDL